MKVFTTVKEGVAKANSLGISASDIASELGLTRQNFNNKLKGLGSDFTKVQLVKVNQYLVNRFNLVQKEINELFGIKGFFPIKEILQENFVVDTRQLQKEWEAMKASGTLETLSDLEELPY